MSIQLYVPTSLLVGKMPPTIEESSKSTEATGSREPSQPIFAY